MTSSGRCGRLLGGFNWRIAFLCISEKEGEMSVDGIRRFSFSSFPF
jgi:hypothetical protein